MRPNNTFRVVIELWEDNPPGSEPGTSVRHTSRDISVSRLMYDRWPDVKHKIAEAANDLIQTLTSLFMERYKED